MCYANCEVAIVGLGMRLAIHIASLISSEPFPRPSLRHERSNPGASATAAVTRGGIFRDVQRAIRRIHVETERESDPRRAARGKVWIERTRAGERTPHCCVRAAC